MYCASPKYLVAALAAVLPASGFSAGSTSVVATLRRPSQTVLLPGVEWGMTSWPLVASTSWWGPRRVRLPLRLPVVGSGGAVPGLVGPEGGGWGPGPGAPR